MIGHLLLDLDNTLYPASGGMDKGITLRMMTFIAEFLDLSLEEAQIQRAQALPNYGTTLEWLKFERGLTNEQGYYDAIHPPSEIDELQKDLNLRPFLKSLHIPMTLLTNAPMSHAQRLLNFFDISDIFLGIFDLTYHKGVGKPHPDCFLSTLDAVGHTVSDTIFVDDHPKYTRGYKSLGGRAILVDESGKHEALARTEGFGHIQSIYQLKEAIAKC